MIFLRTVTLRYWASQRKLPLLYLVWRKNKSSPSAQFSDYFTGQKHKKVLKLHSQVIGFYAPVPLACASLSMVLWKKKKHKTPRTPQKSCEPFPPSIWSPPLAFFLIPLHRSQDQIYPSTAAKSTEIKTFTVRRNKEAEAEEKPRSVSCSGAWEQREPGRSAHNKPVVNLAVKICLKKTANCCMKCIQV